jgi:hypothetical protein
MTVRSGLLLVTFIAASTAGCANSAYLRNRKQDALDVPSVAVGAGAGAKVRVGYLQLGLLYNQDLAGLRMGRFFTHRLESSASHPKMEDQTISVFFLVPLVFHGCERFHLPPGPANAPGKEGTRPSYYEAANFFFLLIPNPSIKTWWWQVEIVAGLGGTVRLGFNAAELADFLLGWAGVEILHDDVEAAPQDVKEEEKAGSSRFGAPNGRVRI